ncbi:MAG: PAS domain-containing sensor histidine kinase, partial [Bacteroidales bacterium]
YILGSLREVTETKEKLTLLNHELSEHKINLESKNIILNKLNKEYLENQIKFKAIFDIVEVGISITDNRGRIIDCNEASDKILGITKEEHLQMDLNSSDWEVIDSNNTPMKNEDLPGVWALENKKPVSNVVMGFARKGKEVIWLNVDVIPLNIEGYGVVITYSDITERKKAEEKLIKYSKELNIMNSDKDKFISILAHDLKSPFTSLIGFSSFLLENINDFDIDTIKEHLGVINDTSNKTYEMLEDILLWLKSQSGQIVFSPKEVNFNEICYEVIHASNIIAKDKNIKLVCHSFEDDRKLFVDPNITKTILRNLISNAIKFSKPNTEVNIYKNMLEDEIIITVSDKGIGISQENLNSIWNPLQSFKNIGTNGEKGTGIGLSICKELVEKQGGRIWIESRLGEGSDFKFSIPLSKVG